METRRLKRDIEAILCEYIGQKMREKGFDPKGKGTSSVMDDLSDMTRGRIVSSSTVEVSKKACAQTAHYDLAVGVALWWLENEDIKSPVENEFIGVINNGHSQYPNRQEREAMILSSFAGILLNILPVEEILSLYNSKPSASCPHQDKKSTIVHPFFLSYHPFAMLSSYKAVDRLRKHTQMLKRWNTERKKGASVQLEKAKSSSIASSSSSSSYSDSEESLKEQTKHYEGSQESLQD